MGDPNNLIGSTSGNSTTFRDMVSTDKGNNFVYSITSFFGTGSMSTGSQPAATDLPVIKNPKFDKGTIFIDLASSFIPVTGAQLIVDDKESFPLTVSSTGIQYTVVKKTPSTPGGIIMKKLIKKGQTVRLTVKNPDGKVSVGVMYTRTK